MAANEHYMQLARSLPSQLQRFFARYPPLAILPATANPEEPQTTYQAERPNPFLWRRNPETGRWHDPVYSTRRQAQLVKLARTHGVEELLPPTAKGTETKLAHRVEFGLRVKGTGVGQKVKGHAHERQMFAKYGALGSAVLVSSSLTRVQDGREEEGHDGDAQADSGLEEGEYRERQLDRFSSMGANSLHRLDGKTGRSGRGEERFPWEFTKNGCVKRYQCTPCINRSIFLPKGYIRVGFGCYALLGAGFRIPVSSHIPRALVLERSRSHTSRPFPHTWA
jgi:large subunit ribosomal protein L25